MPELLVDASWDTILEGAVRTRLERDLLLPFLIQQRWFGGKARQPRSAQFVDWGLLRGGDEPLLITLVSVEFADGGTDRYFLPLACGDSRELDRLQQRTPRGILAAIDGPRRGVLYDAWLDDRFARALLDAFDRQETVRTRAGSVRTIRTPAFTPSRGPEIDLPIRRMSAEQSNTSLVFGDRLILKLVRRAQPGINPDFEIGRQLTEHTSFSRVPAVIGALEYTTPSQEPTTLAMMQQLVASQADGWTHATGHVTRFLESVGDGAPPDVPVPSSVSDMLAAPVPEAIVASMGLFLTTAETLGRRTAEMHIALASDSAGSAFAPEPLTAADLSASTAAAIAQAERTLKTLDAVLSSQARMEAHGSGLPAPIAADASTLLRSRDRLLERIRGAAPAVSGAARIRIHGDYHLGQVLWADEDFYLLDFEGEPARPLAERRLKHSPMKDVAGMVRSFSYATHAGLVAYLASGKRRVDRAEQWTRACRGWVTAAFLRGYVSAAAGAVFLPRDPSQREGLLQLFLLEKALYELEYELNNRPDWVGIPLAGIMDLL